MKFILTKKRKIKIYEYALLLIKKKEQRFICVAIDHVVAYLMYSKSNNIKNPYYNDLVYFSRSSNSFIYKNKNKFKELFDRRPKNDKDRYFRLYNTKNPYSKHEEFAWEIERSDRIRILKEIIKELENK